MLLTPLAVSLPAPLSFLVDFNSAVCAGAEVVEQGRTMITTLKEEVTHAQQFTLTLQNHSESSADKSNL